MSIAPASDFRRVRAQLDEIQAALRELRLDGWLLYDLRGRNIVASSLLGLGEMSRRYFVLIPAQGTPFALTHGIRAGSLAGMAVGTDQLCELALARRRAGVPAGRPYAHCHGAVGARRRARV